MVEEVVAIMVEVEDDFMEIVHEIVVEAHEKVPKEVDLPHLVVCINFTLDEVM